jgi:hypothetical protein
MTKSAIVTRIRTKAVALAIVAAVVASGCGMHAAPIGLELASKTSFQADWHRYTRVRTSKAFAYAGNPGGLVVTGIAYGMTSAIEAETRALDYCEEQRLARGIPTPCILLAIDDEIVRVSAEHPAPSANRKGS